MNKIRLGFGLAGRVSIIFESDPFWERVIIKRSESDLILIQILFSRAKSEIKLLFRIGLAGNIYSPS